MIHVGRKSATIRRASSLSRVLEKSQCSPNSSMVFKSKASRPSTFKDFVVLIGRIDNTAAAIDLNERGMFVLPLGKVAGKGIRSRSAHSGHNESISDNVSHLLESRLPFRGDLDHGVTQGIIEQIAPVMVGAQRDLLEHRFVQWPSGRRRRFSRHRFSGLNRKILGFLGQHLGKLLMALGIDLPFPDFILGIVAFELFVEENPFRITIGLPFAVNAKPAVLGMVLVRILLAIP